MEFLTLAIVGAISSLIFQFIKKYLVDNNFLRMLYATILSLILGIIVYFLNYLPTLKEALLGVLGAANTIYLVVIQWFNPEK